MANRPNVLVILSDQQRRDSLGCYGNSYTQTQTIDRLSAEGATFTNAFCANVICTPSRASILTGRMPRAHRCFTNGCYLRPEEKTLAEVLLDDGYRTRHVGKLHLSPHRPIVTKFPNPQGWLSPEGPEFWAQDLPVPSPYYGFQQVRLCSGHSSDHMHYSRWLRTQDRGLYELLSPEHALEPPSGAPFSWKSAIPEEYHVSTWVADQAIEALNELAKGPEPFFLHVGFPDPHFPYAPPAPWCYRYNVDEMPLPSNRDRSQTDTGSTEFHRRMRQFTDVYGYHPMDTPSRCFQEITAHTFAMVDLLDFHAGRILTRLEQLGLRENTIVVFTTDHGEHMGDHWLVYKAMIYEELIRLPLVWSWPGEIAAGARIDGMVSHIDIMPTLLDLLGVRTPYGIQGASHADGLRRGNVAGRPFVYLEDDDSGDARTFCRTVRTDRHRLTYQVHHHDGELYDLQEDPREIRNLWHEAGAASVRRTMTELLLEAACTAADPNAPKITTA